MNSKSRKSYPEKWLFSVSVLSFVLCVIFLSSCATAPITDNTKKAEVYYKLGISYLNKNQLKEAYVKFQQAIQINPKDKYSLNALGYISTRFKEYDDAISYYSRAIAIDPNYSEALNNLGVMYIEIKEWDQAAKYFRLALKNPLYLTPDRAYSGLGFALYKKGDYLEAEKTLKESLIRYPDSAQSAHALGLVYMALGKIDPAIETFNKTLDIAPHFIDTHWELAQAYLRVGETRRALDHFEIVAESTDDREKSKKALAYIELLKTSP
jgi:type IV pilus biogenesis/stability protein PilW